MQDNRDRLLARGVYAALATPLRPKSIEVDTAAFLEYLDKVSAAGVDGLLFFGATGEFIHFCLEERMRVISLVAKRSRLPFLVNVSHSTLLGAAQLAEHAMDVGAAGMLLMPPNFYRYGDDEIEQFYREFGRIIDGLHPLYLYNLPSCVSPISPRLAERLLATGAFAGIKDSGGEWENLKLLLGLRDRHPFQLLLGNEGICLKGLLAGTNGMISGVAAAIPELPVAIYRAVKALDSIAAQNLAIRLDEFLAWIVKFPPIVAIKNAANARGWLSAELANPLGIAAEEELYRFHAWIAAWLPATLAECAALSVRT